MSEVLISKVNDSIYGNLVKITNGIIELTASLDFGPRILSFNLCGKENMFYNDTEKSSINDEEFAPFGGGTFKCYGGHRLWISPEILPRCYYPDNNPVALTETKTGVVLAAPTERYNNIQKTIEIRLNDYNSDVEIIHAIRNEGSWDVVLAPWALTMMAQGGVTVVPQADRDTGYLNNRFIGLWPYTKLTDERVYWGDKYIVLRQDPTVEQAFKIGINNEKGWAAYFCKGQMFIKRYNHVIDGMYPDFSGCSYETYTNKSFLEMETLGQIGIVSRGAVVLHLEKWELHAEDFVPGTDEQKISETIGKYV